MEITVNIRCDALVKAINRFCDVMSNQDIPTTTKPTEIKANTSEENNKTEIKSQDDNSEENKKSETKSHDDKAAAKAISIADVRKVLAEKTQSGKGAEVKELLSKYGAVKLSEIDAKDYAALLNEAEGL